MNNDDCAAACLLAGYYPGTPITCSQSIDGSSWWLWRLHLSGGIKSVVAPNWISAGYRFYVWERVQNDREGDQALRVVMAALFPGCRLKFLGGEGIDVEIWRHVLSVPAAYGAAADRLDQMLAYMRQTYGIEPPTSSEFLKRAVDADPFLETPSPAATLDDIARGDAALSEAEREVDR